jgi:uncharacterized repeat protein (TIGR01451 family)
MFQGKKVFVAMAAMFACSAGSQAFAADPGCIVLKSVAEVEQDIVNDKGEKSKKLVPVQKAVPGVEVIWTVTAQNTCKQPSEKVTINNAVPAHMTYVSNSAVGPGSDISYSVDGKTFASTDQLTVVDNGASRPARSDEYHHIRWVLKDPLAPGAQAMARFRAVLN